MSEYFKDGNCLYTSLHTSLFIAKPSLGFVSGLYIFSCFLLREETLSCKVAEQQSLKEALECKIAAVQDEAFTVKKEKEDFVFNLEREKDSVER